LDQEKLPKNRNNLFTGKIGKNPSGEQQRRIPFPGWTEQYVMEKLTCLKKQLRICIHVVHEFAVATDGGLPW